MHNSLLLIIAFFGTMLASCGGRESVATSAPAITSVVSAATTTSTSSAPDNQDAQASGSNPGPGVARTSYQERQRLHTLALEQKRTGKKGRKTKSGGFFSSLLGTSSAKNNSARYRPRRNGNNISSLNGLFGRRKSRR